jgi:hypothetical protein
LVKCNDSGVKVISLVKLLGIPVSNKPFKIWSKLLVYPVAPFFLTNELRYQTSNLYLIRSEFTATIRDLSFHDLYTTYNAGLEASWVTLLKTRELQDFSKELRLELLQLQAKLGPGQIYNFDEYKNLLEDSELEP